MEAVEFFFFFFFSFPFMKGGGGRVSKASDHNPPTTTSLLALGRNQRSCYDMAGLDFQTTASDMKLKPNVKISESIVSAWGDGIYSSSPSKWAKGRDSQFSMQEKELPERGIWTSAFFFFFFFFFF